MIESFPQNFELPEEKKPEQDQELEFENLELVESKEEELREGFVKELKKPHEGSYFKKLERIGAAFALAGLLTVAVPETATLPEKSREFKELEALDHYEKTDPLRYINTLNFLQKKIEEKGGIEISPQLPEEVYKPNKWQIAFGAQMLIGRKETPYFSKPEIVLGKEFIQKNPEQAKEYFERISKTQKATVIVENKEILGSGVIINTKKGKIILTNKHIVGEEKTSLITFINGNKAEAEVLNTDSEYDVAILKIDFPDEMVEKILKGTNSLDVDPDIPLKSLEPQDRIALIGHPMGYPFEVSLAKVVNVESKLFQRENQNGFLSSEIIFEPDERFVKLAAFETGRKWEEGGALARKGESIWGMSGGPIIKLDEKGEPRLIGINAKRMCKPLSYFYFGIGVHAEALKDFLEKSGYPASVPEKEISK